MYSKLISNVTLRAARVRVSTNKQKTSAAEICAEENKNLGSHLLFFFLLRRRFFYSLKIVSSLRRRNGRLGLGFVDSSATPAASYGPGI